MQSADDFQRFCDFLKRNFFELLSFVRSWHNVWIFIKWKCCKLKSKMFEFFLESRMIGKNIFFRPDISYLRPPMAFIFVINIFLMRLFGPKIFLHVFFDQKLPGQIFFWDQETFKPNILLTKRFFAQKLLSNWRNYCVTFNCPGFSVYLSCLFRLLEDISLIIVPLGMESYVLILYILDSTIKKALDQALDQDVDKGLLLAYDNTLGEFHCIVSPSGNFSTDKFIIILVWPSPTCFLCMCNFKCNKLHRLL